MLNVHEFEILPTFTSSYLTNGKMCVNVIYEVLAILAIGLVNISVVGLSSLEIQWPENTTSRVHE